MQQNQENILVSITEAKKLLPKLMASGAQPLLVGPPACGKSAVIAEAALAAGVDFEVIVGSAWERCDVAYPYPAPEEKRMDSLLNRSMKRLVDAKATLWCLWDDLGQAHVLQPSIMQIVHGGRLNDIRISPSVKHIAASNEAGDRSGARMILEALKTRFAPHLKLVPDLDGWTEWALADGNIHPTVISFHRITDGQHLYTHKPSNSYGGSCTLRNWEKLSRFVASGITADQVFYGTVGDVAALEFGRFVRIAEQLPEPEYCFASPETAKVPDDFDARHLVLSTLAAKVEKQTLKGFFTYIERFPETLQALAVVDAAKRNKKLAADATYLKWRVEHRALFGSVVGMGGAA